MFKSIQITGQSNSIFSAPSSFFALVCTIIGRKPFTPAAVDKFSAMLLFYSPFFPNLDIVVIVTITKNVTITMTKALP